MSAISIDIADRLKRLPPYMFGRINQTKDEKRKAGVDIIDLCMGNPSDPSPDFVVDKLCEAVKAPRNQRYSASKGLFNLRREIAQDYERRWKVELDPDTEVIAVIGWEVERPKGGMFLWAAMPEEFLEMGSMNFSLKLMDEAFVSVAPGIGFGDLGEGHVRIALVENEQRIKQAARQIGSTFQKWRKCG